MIKPDRWAVFKLNNKGKTYFKVIGGWLGGYLDGDAYRINSGIKKVEKDGEFFLFHGFSGSIYKCHEKAYGLTHLMSSVLSPAKDKITVLDEDYNFLDMEIIE